MKHEETLASLDYAHPNRILAQQSGLPLWRIANYRRIHGKGKATIFAPQQRPKKMQIDPFSIDWSKSQTEIAKEAGVSRQRINQLARMWGKNQPESL